MIDFLILNYNDAETTKSLVKLIENYKSIRKIVLVDNCSKDDSFSVLEECANEKVDVIVTDKNGGYGYGNNYGIKYLAENYNSKFVLLANPDIVVSEAVICKLEEFLINNSEYALVAPFMLNSNGERQLNTGWRIPSTMQYVLSCGILYSHYKKPSLYKDILISNDFVKDVDAISGSLFLLNVDKFIESGMYDENIFLYCEETVLGIKLKNAGYKSAILLQEKYIHNHSVSISKTYKTAIKRRKLMLDSKLYVLKTYYKANPLLCFIGYIISKISILEMMLLSLFKKREDKR